MNVRKYSELLDRFFSGNTSPEENDMLFRLFKEELPDGKFDEYSNFKWQTSPEVLTDEIKDKIKASIFRKIRSERRKSRSVRTVRFWAFSAAAAAVVAISVIFGYALAELRTPVQKFEICADRGQKSMAVLPDGTRVWLNSASRISYTSSYNIRDRKIELDGEAFFDVAENKDMPFDVVAGMMTVRALGTKFNVKSFAEEKKITAVLVEGRVKAFSDEKEVFLDPWQQVVLDTDTGSMHKSDVVNRNNPVPWRQNSILFEGETLEQVAVMLERMYNVDVVLSEDVSSYSYTGLISNNSLMNVLDLISGTSPVEYSIYGNVVKFTSRK